MSNNQIVSEKILGYMNKLKFTQAYVAGQVGVTRATVNHWVNGLTARLSYPNTFALADLFQLKGDERRQFFDDMGCHSYSPDPSAHFPPEKIYVPRIALLYEVQDALEKNQIELIIQMLKKQNYQIFDEKDLNRLFSAIEQADYVLVIVSAKTTYSPLLLEKVSAAYEVALKNFSKPTLLGLCLDTQEDLPQDLRNLLPDSHTLFLKSAELSLNKSVWEKDLLNKFANQSFKPYELEMIGGAIPLKSKFYIERQVDTEFEHALQRRDSIILVKGPRQVGKTSLLARGIQYIKQQGSLVLLTDFQKLVDSNLKSLESFFMGVGNLIAAQLDLDNYPQDRWRKDLTPNLNFDIYMRREILGRTERRVVWVIDEADKLLGHSFSDDIFSLFRTWHNERALSPDEPCHRLTLILGYATEPYLFIKDLNQSPFNVGTKITLRDFALDHVTDLNSRYGFPLYKGELEDFHRFTGGHPFLVRSALNDMVVNNLRWIDFMQKVESDEGVFADHLRRIVMLLRQDTELLETVKQFLLEKQKPAYNHFFRLHSAGLLSGTQENPYFRCQIYAHYLRKCIGG